ncbi:MULTISPECIES: hypothetical protein [Chryseobacterium]|uniref:hypothetical protein n=1 Tax=Chryseobacterium TaxID=59732 RepID=UPI001297DB63|nr:MULTISPECIES: hypothetical protein [Chryseobacterium]MDR6921955.1 hypothetical protein [Chryseobacterium sp. 2987]
MKKPDKIINLNFNNTEYNVEVTVNLDKIEGFLYYTFKFGEDHSITISQFDGEKWEIASMTKSNIADKLGKIIEAIY